MVDDDGVALAVGEALGVLGVELLQVGAEVAGVGGVGLRVVGVEVVEPGGHLVPDVGQQDRVEPEVRVYVAVVVLLVGVLLRPPAAWLVRVLGNRRSSTTSVTSRTSPPAFWPTASSTAGWNAGW